MEKKQIITLSVAVALFGIAGYILFKDGDAAPIPMQKRVVEVPPPAIAEPVAPLQERAALALPIAMPVLESRREMQRVIEEKALEARRYGLEAETEKAKAEIASAKAAQAESRLRARRAKAAPLKEDEPESSSMANVPMTMPSPMPIAPMSIPSVPTNQGEAMTRSEPKEPRGLDGARLVMVSGGIAMIAVDGRTVRLRQGESSGGYRVAEFDQMSRAVTLRDARGRSRTLYLDMAAPRASPELTQEKRNAAQVTVPTPISAMTPTAPLQPAI